MKALVREGALRGRFRSELAASHGFDLAMALVTLNGLRQIEDALISFLRRGGRCRVLFGTDLPTEPDAVARLMELSGAHPGVLDLRWFRSKGDSDFHAKLALFHKGAGRKTAIVGSSNLTGKGLCHNVEAGVLVDDRPAVKALLEFFEEHFEGYQAVGVDHRWLQM